MLQGGGHGQCRSHEKSSCNVGALPCVDVGRFLPGRGGCQDLKTLPLRERVLQVTRPCPAEGLPKRADRGCGTTHSPIPAGERLVGCGLRSRRGAATTISPDFPPPRETAFPAPASLGRARRKVNGIPRCGGAGERFRVLSPNPRAWTMRRAYAVGSCCEGGWTGPGRYARWAGACSGPAWAHAVRRRAGFLPRSAWTQAVRRWARVCSSSAGGLDLDQHPDLVDVGDRGPPQPDRPLLRRMVGDDEDARPLSGMEQTERGERPHRLPAWSGPHPASCPAWSHRGSSCRPATAPR